MSELDIGQQRKCSNCRFFASSTESQDRTNEGRCKRYAPRPELEAVAGFTSWPKVWAGTWCGEWQSRHA